MSRSPAPRAALCLVIAATLGACHPAYRPPVNVAASTACRAEVDRVYAAQNRVDLSRQDQRDSPFAANFLKGDTTRGLGAEYGRDNQYASCIANAATPPAAGAAAPGPAATIGPAFTPASR